MAVLHISSLAQAEDLNQVEKFLPHIFYTTVWFGVEINNVVLLTTTVNYTAAMYRCTFIHSYCSACCLYSCSMDEWIVHV